MNSIKIPLTVIVLTYNEEKNIRQTLESVADWCTEIFIVDSGSNDQTTRIAGEYSRVYCHPFETFSKQWRWAIESLPIENEWILGLDADQRITPELVQELQGIFTQSHVDADGFYIKRRQYFMGRWIKYGTYYPRYLLKLFRIDKVFLDERELMDHHFYVEGKTCKLKYDFIEDNRKEILDFWIDKHNRYASMQAREEIEGDYAPLLRASFFGNQDERRLWFKRIWIHLPLFIRPLLYFCYRYFIRMGFLDGKEGLIFHFLQGFWYRFLVDAKIYEMRRDQQREN